MWYKPFRPGSPQSYFSPNILSKLENIQVADMGKAVKPVLCHMTGGNQYWMFRLGVNIVNQNVLCTKMKN